MLAHLAHQRGLSTRLQLQELASELCRTHARLGRFLDGLSSRSATTFWTATTARLGALRAHAAQGLAHHSFTESQRATGRACLASHLERGSIDARALPIEDLRRLVSAGYLTESPAGDSFVYALAGPLLALAQEQPEPVMVLPPVAVGAE